jgi:hypothetical protein
MCGHSEEEHGHDPDYPGSSACTVEDCDCVAYDPDQAETCDHKWEFIRDWYGDPNVINGTADCSFWRCSRCDEETSSRPDDWDDPREIAADMEYDRRKDEGEL